MLKADCIKYAKHDYDIYFDSDSVCNKGQEHPFFLKNPGCIESMRRYVEIGKLTEEDLIKIGFTEKQIKDFKFLTC